MKALIAITASLLMLTSVAAADDHYTSHNGPWRQPAPVERNRINPWPFIAGAVVGGLIVHEAQKEYPRYVTVCNDVHLFDSFGRYVKTERVCHQEIGRAHV